jgi:hypothetical protein
MNDRAISKVALALAASTLVAWTAAADDAVTLAWKFKKGQQLGYVVEQSTTSEGQFAGQTIKSTVSQTMDMQWTIDSVAADGIAQMTQTISRVRLKVTQPGAPGIEYDSSSKEAPQGAAAQIGAVFKLLVGKPVKLKMSPRGTISDVTLPEGLAEEMKKSAGPTGAMLNEESFKQMTGASTIEFADHPVKKGDTWQSKATMSNPAAGGKQTTNTTYTYQGTEKEHGKQIDRIDVSLKTSIAPAGAGSPQIEIKDQKSEGDIDFDRAAGHVVKSHAKLKMSMAINLMGTKVDQTATTETTMRLADGAAGKPSDK